MRLGVGHALGLNFAPLEPQLPSWPECGAVGRSLLLHGALTDGKPDGPDFWDFWAIF